MTQKALIISYYWPPSGGSGVQRWMYFAKYLGENNIEPTVITINPKNASFPAWDESLLEHTKNIKVIHTKNGFQPLKLYSLLKFGKKKDNITFGDFGVKGRSKFDRIAGYIRANWFIPDARIGWNKNVIPLAKELLIKDKFDYLITTGPPHSTHLIGLELKKELPIKWVADLRDPWIEVFYNKLFDRTKKAQLKDENLERNVLQNADLILTVGPSLRAMLAKKIAGQEDKVKYLYNGFDETIFENKTAKRYNEFTLTHIGIWGVQQSYQEVIMALKQLLEENINLEIRFVLVGTVSELIIEELTKIQNLIVDYRGRMSHSEAIQEMLNADLLLNCLAIDENSKILVSGKLMEYLATGKKVIVIGDPDGDAAKLISEFDHANIVVPGDSITLKKLIFETVESNNRTKEEFSPSMKYTRRELTKKLASLLKTL